MRVGISPSRSPYMMPAIIENFLKENQRARIVIEEKTTAELAERLALYENATVGSEGMLVYYFVLDKKETDRALEALSGR